MNGNGEERLIYKGKTKDVYDLGEGRVLLRFKDDVTGENGVFDPGANTVGLAIAGIGAKNLSMSVHFFKLLNGKGVLTHFLDADVSKGQMTVKAVSPFGKGVEVICSYDEIPLVMETLRPEGLYLAVDGVPDRDTGLNLLKRLERWCTGRIHPAGGR